MLPPAKMDMPLKGDTVIENDVWIGQNAVILPGVYIGNGAIIGANSVVGSDVAPYAPRLSANLNAEHTASVRSREAPCRLSAPSLACLFLGIFFIVQQVGHIPQADAQGGHIVKQGRSGGRQEACHAADDEGIVVLKIAHDGLLRPTGPRGAHWAQRKKKRRRAGG